MNVERARRLFRAALRADPGAVRAARGLAELEGRAGNAVSAAQVAQCALDSHPNNPHLLLTVAQRQHRGGDCKVGLCQPQGLALNPRPICAGPSFSFAKLCRS